MEYLKAERGRLVSWVDGEGFRKRDSGADVRDIGDYCGSKAMGVVDVYSKEESRAEMKTDELGGRGRMYYYVVHFGRVDVARYSTVPLVVRRSTPYLNTP